VALFKLGSSCMHPVRTWGSRFSNMVDILTEVIHLNGIGGLTCDWRICGNEWCIHSAQCISERHIMLSNLFITTPPKQLSTHTIFQKSACYWPRVLFISIECQVLFLLNFVFFWLFEYLIVCVLFQML